MVVDCKNIFLGAFAVYLEPWHADIFEFLDLRKNHGKVSSLASQALE